MAARAAIQRQLNRTKQSLNIFTQAEFWANNSMLDAVLHQNKKDGVTSQAQHKEAMTEQHKAELSKINTFWTTLRHHNAKQPGAMAAVVDGNAFSPAAKSPCLPSIKVAMTEHCHRTVSQRSR